MQFPAIVVCISFVRSDVPCRGISTQEIENPLSTLSREQSVCVSVCGVFLCVLLLKHGNTALSPVLKSDNSQNVRSTDKKRT